MKCLLGEKQNMAQVFGEDGSVTPVTVLAGHPSTVVFVRSKERDGYSAVQIGAGVRKEKNLSQAVKGHMGDLGSFRWLKEFRDDRGGQSESAKVGDVLDVSQFAVGDKVTVSAISKGKGFQGVVKRHNFAGGPRSHGQKHSEREPGSIGATGPQRVLKGTKMAGRMGGKRRTVLNLEVVKVVPEENLLLVKGAVPGHRGTCVEIRTV